MNSANLGRITSGFAVSVSLAAICGCEGAQSAPSPVDNRFDGLWAESRFRPEAAMLCDIQRLPDGRYRLRMQHPLSHRGEEFEVVLARTDVPDRFAGKGARAELTIQHLDPRCDGVRSLSMDYCIDGRPSSALLDRPVDPAGHSPAPRDPAADFRRDLAELPRNIIRAAVLTAATPVLIPLVPVFLMMRSRGC